MKIKNNFKKFCLSFLIAGFLVSSAFAYSSEAVRLYNLGIEDVKQENYTKAAENFEKAIFQDKSLKDAYFNLGAVYKQLGEMNKAKDVISILLRKEPFDDEATFFLANLYFETNDYDKAMLYLNTIGELSVRYDKAQDLISVINENQIENMFAEKKASRTWKQKSLKDFEAPAGVAADSKGNLYVANYKDSVIQKISPNGEKEDIINEHVVGPVGLAIDSQDNLYVSGYMSNKIVRISPDGEAKVVLDNIKRPYYLFVGDDILYITEQEENSLIMINLWELK